MREIDEARREGTGHGVKPKTFDSAKKSVIVRIAFGPFIYERIDHIAAFAFHRWNLWERIGKLSALTAIGRKVVGFIMFAAMLACMSPIVRMLVAAEEYAVLFCLLGVIMAAYSRGYLDNER